MRLIEKVWFQGHNAKYLLVPILLPFTLLFWLVSALRRQAFRLGISSSEQPALPTIVVGNIGIGGNGKTPLTIHLIKCCQQLGIKVGIISRGYGGNASHYPYVLSDSSLVEESGDEPFLIYHRCKVPVVVGKDRIASIKELAKLGCHLVLADDGLQHYQMARNAEIIVVDGKRGFGNGLLLPAGPLREGRWRLKTASMLVVNGDNNINLTAKHASMQLKATKLVNIKSGESIELADFIGQYQQVNAVAGIGDPERFFNTLSTCDINVVEKQGFVDHHQFTLADFQHFDNQLPLLMTEKDAVKCHSFAQAHWWYLSVDASFNEQDSKYIMTHLEKWCSKHNSKIE